VSTIEHTRPHHPVRRRLGSAALTFVVVAGAIYATAWVALGLLRHVVMPIVAVLVGGYVARHVYRSMSSRD
jgi:divalent metal cation (Fe/Co/Zn/Cd) transporter